MSQQINLYNPALFPRRDWLSVRIVGSVLLALLVVVLLAAVMLGVELYGANKKLAVLNQSVSSRDAAVKAMQASIRPKHPDPRLQAEVERTTAAVGRMQRALQLLEQGGLGEAGGFSPYMQAFARETLDGVWLTGFNVGADGEFALRGRALKADSVSVYLKRLQGEPALAGKTLAGFRLWRGTQGKGQDSGAGAGRPAPYLDFIARSSAFKEGEPGEKDGADNGG